MASNAHTSSENHIPVRFYPAVFEYAGKEIIRNISRIDRHKCRPSDLAREMANTSWNKLAAIDRCAGYQQIKGLDAALYVAAPSSDIAAKIGVTSHPVKRIEQLQTGSHEQLRFTHLIWLPSKSAYGVERLIIRVLERLDKRLKGEWCSLSPDDLAYVAVNVLLETNVLMSTSHMFRQTFVRLLGDLGDDHDSSPYRFDAERVLLRRERGKLGLDPTDLLIYEITDI